MTATQELRILQAARLKGRPTVDDIATSTGEQLETVRPLLAELVSSGRLAEAGSRIKLTADGRERLGALIVAERAEVDQTALTAAYHEFDGHNSAFKQLMTDWQLIDGTTPNDHTDSAYDAGIVKRLGDIDEAFVPLLGKIVKIAPRLEPYGDRFASALEKVEAGDHTWFARPLVDSYHTVWFELHEDLIGLAGLSRVEEAAAGRAE